MKKKRCFNSLRKGSWYFFITNIYLLTQTSKKHSLATANRNLRAEDVLASVVYDVLLVAVQFAPMMEEYLYMLKLEYFRSLKRKS